MTTGSSPDPEHEVLTHGDEEPPRRRRWLVAAALLAVCAWLVVDHDWSSPESPRDALGSPEDAAEAAVDVDTAPVPLPPEATELAGVWFVATAPEWFEPGQLWMAFHSDGSFVLDPGGGLLSPEPWARGHYDLDGTRLALTIRGGTGCRQGDRLEWTVGVLPDGRLDVRQVSDNGGQCRALPGVWRARPLEDRDMSRVRWRQ